MAGIYIHIPFCKQVCSYCNFHFSTSVKLKDDFLKALLKEIEFRKDYLKNEKVKTIYFGGGTPSILNNGEINRIFDHLSNYFLLDKLEEVTLEANPDDLHFNYLKSLKNTSVNRLSIGVQSFFDKDLKFINRAHNTIQANQSIKNAMDAGFKNLNIDLIYGLQKLNDENWEKNLQLFFEFKIPHLSAYCLTIEPKTLLHNQIKKGKTDGIDEDKCVRQFEFLMNKMEEENYSHYEISNFCKEGYRAKHNSSYWSGENYLGLGPSAHSFNGISRQWNVSNNIKYIDSLLSERPTENNNEFYEIEFLTTENKHNEYILTSLRTHVGCDTKFIIEQFGKKYFDIFIKNCHKKIKNETLIMENGFVKLTRKGKFFADKIASDLFV